MYKALSTATLMSMPKRKVIDILRCAEHNAAAAETMLAQQAENLKDWQPVIRCKDCAYWDAYSGVCARLTHDVIDEVYTKADDFLFGGRVPDDFRDLTKMKIADILSNYADGDSLVRCGVQFGHQED